MSSSSKTKIVREVIAAVCFAAALAGCSDIYYDRRETVAFGADDAIATNRAIQMVDPWPRYSANRNIAFNGERMQRSVECYRADKSTTPISQITSTSLVAAGQTGTPSTRCEGKMSSGVSQPAAVSQTNAQTGTSTTVINP